MTAAGIFSGERHFLQVPLTPRTYSLPFTYLSENSTQRDLAVEQLKVMSWSSPSYR
jgi:hypothetical protein